MINSKFEMVELKYVGDVSPGSSPPSSTYNEQGNGVPFIQGSGEFGDQYPNPEQYCTSPERIAKAGDLLISVRAPVGELNEAKSKLGIGRGVAAFRPDSEFFDQKYAKYALEATLPLLEGESTGSTFSSVSSNDLGSLKIPLPPLECQKKIYTFLDSRLNTISLASRKQAELRDRLQEKLESLKTTVVFDGLNEAQIQKDSGIDPFGDIPAHWEVKPNRAVFKQVDEKSEDGEGTLLSVSHKTGVTPRSEKDVNMFESDSLEGYKIVQEGDFVINTMWAWMGAVGISPCDGLVSPSYHVYRPNQRMTNRFIDLLYRTRPYVTQMGRYSKGVWKSRNRLYPDAFLRMKTIIPPISEQKEIVKEVSNEAERIEELREKLETHSDLLAERRDSLVTKAVVGQIDINHTQQPQKQQTPS